MNLKIYNYFSVKTDTTKLSAFHVIYQATIQCDISLFSWRRRNYDSYVSRNVDIFFLPFYLLIKKKLFTLLYSFGLLLLFLVIFQLTWTVCASYFYLFLFYFICLFSHS